MKCFWIAAAVLSIGVGPHLAYGQDVRFLRGDSNDDGVMDISDAVTTLLYLFIDKAFELDCEDAADSNDDGALDISDASYALNSLFLGGPPPPSPFSRAGCDPTEDALSCLVYGDNSECVETGAIIADHTGTDVDAIPVAWIEAAKDNFRMYYGHTSHGSQVMSGIGTMRDALFDYNNGEGTLSIRETGGDLGNPNFTEWAVKTRAQLDRPDNDRNLVMWSWCGQASGISESVLQRDYLESMSSLEADYPDVTFVYMTGHLDGRGVDGNLHQRNEQIREYCRANGKTLFDFADIESYDPDGNYYLDLAANDNCDYDAPEGGRRNWADDWCEAHPGECASCGCAHSKCLNCQRKGRVFWWMMARVAGWPG